MKLCRLSYEPWREKAGLRCFRPGLTQTELYKNRRRPEAGNFELRKKKNCTIPVAKTKALISFAVTAKLICAFVFAYAKIWFSHDAAHIKSQNKRMSLVEIKIVIFSILIECIHKQILV